jgi:cytochrome c oxidase assembly factor CtaG
VLALAFAVLVLAVTPPLASLALRYVAAEAGQYCLLAIVVPALTCLGAPWHLLGLGTILEKVAARRANHSRLRSAASAVLPALAVMIAWRTAPLVDRLAHDRWLLAVEVVTLVPAGMAIWLELVPSPPVLPRLAPYLRMAVAAVIMWTTWVCAYLVGLSNTVTYRAYSAVPHRAIGIFSDQQLAAGVMWFVAAAAFLPMAFLGLMSWLRRDTAEG